MFCMNDRENCSILIPHKDLPIVNKQGETSSSHGGQQDDYSLLVYFAVLPPSSGRSLKLRSTITRLHGEISQKTLTFKQDET
jgi:hypothetical protein